MNITKEDIIDAYLTLKSSIYHENNTMIFLKEKIAQFEDENNFLEENVRDKFFQQLYDKIKTKNQFSDEISQINYIKIIKKYHNGKKEISKKIEEMLDKDEIEEIRDFLSKNIDENFQKNKIEYNYIIDCSIILHIISILWIKKVGYLLDREITKYSYGNRLEYISEDNKKVKFKKLFKRYIYQYQEWKNLGIKKIKEIVEENEKAVSIGLDLKKFYYNIKFEKLEEEINNALKKYTDEMTDYLTEIIYTINREYDKILKEDLLREEITRKNNNILPIGIYSSAILANFYLRDLDEEILKKLAPAYYGRYVDDIFLVFKEYYIDEKEYLKNKLDFLKNNEKLKYLELDISLNSSKENITFFNDDLKQVEINKLESEFLSRTSTFAFFSNEKEIDKLYTKIATEKNDNLKIEKYNIAIYLAKLFQIYSDVDKESVKLEVDEISKELINLFSEENIIKYSAYYEKVFSFFVMNNLSRFIIEFYNKIEKFIKEKEKENEENIKYIKNYLNTSLSFAIALNPKIRVNLKKFIKEKISGNFDLKLEQIINSNMFNQKYIFYPLINYTKEPREEILKINFYKHRYMDLSLEKVELNENKLYLSPRFIHLDEISNFYLKNEIFNNELNEESYIENIEKMHNCNFKFLFNSEKANEKVENIIYKTKDGLNYYKIDDEKINRKIRLGVANFLVNDSTLKILDGEQDLSFKKKERIMNLLNEAKKHKVDILIFPEVSIPYQWLKILYKFSRENKILITGGLEHIYNKNLEFENKNIPKYAYNCLFTILPFNIKKYKSSFLKLRLKNYYAPGEKQIIEGKKYAVPKVKEVKYDIFSWRGIHFSNFNCFELSDIMGRGALKNLIDLLIASVHNRDVSYFKNIIESTCRDIHVFIAQSNTSIYGDCGIFQPTKKENMILGMMKGGINDSLLVEEIDIQGLRKFQMLTNEAQVGGKYKLTPPGIDSNIVKKRMENKLIGYFENKGTKNDQIK